MGTMRIGSRLVAAGKQWRADHCQRLGAALAYYAICSIAPIVLIAIALSSTLYETEQAQTKLITQVEVAAGPAGRAVIEAVLSASHSEQSDVLAAIFGTIILLIGAGGIFGQTKSALNTIWNVPVHITHRHPFTFVLRNIFSFVMVIITGALFILSIAITAYIARAEAFLTSSIGVSADIWQLVHILSLFVITTLLFTLIYKYIPDVKHSFMSLLPGASIAALLCIVGKTIFELYLTMSAVGLAYGGASSVIILLLWLYYGAQIFLYGAEFAKVSNKPYSPSAQSL